MDKKADLPPSYELATNPVSAPPLTYGFDATPGQSGPQPAVQPAYEKSSGMPQPFVQPVNQPMAQPFPQQAPQPVHQPMVQPAVQPVYQPTTQPIIVQPGYQPVQPSVVYPGASVASSLISSGPQSVPLTCPYCQQRVDTVTKTSPSIMAYATCAALCMVGLAFGCCLIPFFVDSCMDTEHTCPNCKRFLSKYSPLASQMGPRGYRRDGYYY